MDYTGVIIEESLDDKAILKRLKILSTEIKPVTERMKSPWLTQWTLHTVLVPEKAADVVAAEISAALEMKHPWYADYRNDRWHYVVFRGKIFKVDWNTPGEYKAVTDRGVGIGIPKYQVSFANE
jgi:hypothetical protein